MIKVKLTDLVRPKNRYLCLSQRKGVTIAPDFKAIYITQGYKNE